MDSLFFRCSVYDTRVSFFPRPTSLVSHLPSISAHSIALTTPDFLLAFVRSPPTILISSKISWRISCEGIPTKPSHLNPYVQKKRKCRHDAMKDFLLMECCFSSSEITLLTSKDPSLFRRKSTERAQEAVQMFRDYGLTVEQVKRAISRNPNIITRTTTHLKHTFEYLRRLGIAEKDVNYIVSYNPRILNFNLDKTLAPRIFSLMKYFGSKANLFKALRKAPGIASCDVELVNNKLKVLENAGLLEHDIKQLLQKKPQFLCSSVGKIEKNMKFLTCTLGLSPNVVVTNPVFLDLSVEKRMRPRFKVFQYLNLRRSRLSLVSSLMISEENFTLRFLSGRPEVKMLYETYKSKTADVEIPELLLTKDNLELNADLQCIR